ncbi:unnamed protein product (macronuclear) [Paramecium tetraurelia]|uniref:SET domain-containing protein n=1 Tax=Paramecium tetraurelia TaxID=5888 RepID=A0E7K8_PARTE|nr:uncharacterized protein GSPATT00024003001 [Paramecium tetraurelia]CAK91275.1 unnamed protein product [Paramecium tetraurelia]|eukprot:XP_001458672.1 hypothetical protein (macronuclear) [Paramecium tetraurelia strain d4-2]
MQQTTSISKRIATIFHNIKGIYKEDPQAQDVEGQKEFQEYVDYLLERGMKINNLRMAQFKTRNNLPYLGLKTIEKIESDSILVSVPRELMLTTKIAYFSDIQEIFDAYPQFFSQHCAGGWQDRILLTYLLYQSQLGRQSQWYHLIANLPRDIDYLIFWSDEELKLLNDEKLVLKAKRELQDFLLIQKTLTHILDQYPQHFKKETYSLENIKWIFIHLVSRCFGSTLEQVAFVPFCEMFNHENTDVRYKGLYLESNVNKPKEDKQLDPNESDDSDGDSDSYEQDDYQYPIEIQEQIKNYKQKTPTYKLIEQELALYQNQVDFQNPDAIEKLRLYQEKCNNRIDLQIQFLKYKRWFQENLNLRDNFTIIFVSKSLEYIQEQIKLYETDVLTYDQVSSALQAVEEKSELYLQNVKEYAQEKLKSKNYSLKQFEIPEQPSAIESVEEMLQIAIPENIKPFEAKEEWKEDLFDNFVIKCSSKDEFEKGAQAYFSYGKISNRSLLLRYGFTLEYNIFDYVEVKTQFIQYIPFASDIAAYFQLSKYKKFKIRYTRINDDLLMYFKILNWQYDQGISYLFDDIYDTAIIDQAYNLIKAYHDEHFKDTLKSQSEKLRDSKLNYHDYFALIYHIEQQRIIEAQLEALQMLKCKNEKKDFGEQQFEWTSYLVEKFTN